MGADQSQQLLRAGKKVLNQIYMSGACGVAFEGGEPLLRRDLSEILSFSRSLPLHTNIITNGTILEKNRRNSPLPKWCCICFFGWLEKTHNTIRRVNGCFDKVVRGITAAKQKVPITINTAIMSENVDEIENMVQFAKEMGIKISIAH